MPPNPLALAPLLLLAALAVGCSLEAPDDEAARAAALRADFDHLVGREQVLASCVRCHLALAPGAPAAPLDPHRVEAISFTSWAEHGRPWLTGLAHRVTLRRGGELVHQLPRAAQGTGFDEQREPSGVDDAAFQRLAERLAASRYFDVPGPNPLDDSEDVVFLELTVHTGEDERSTHARLGLDGPHASFWPLHHAVRGAVIVARELQERHDALRRLEAARGDSGR